MDTQTTATPTRQRLTVHEAQLLITRARGKWLYLACSQFAEVGDLHFQGFAVGANVKVTRKAARQFLSEAYRGKNRDRMRVIVYEYPDCIFIGNNCP